jgi:hypothetical protein
MYTLPPDRVWSLPDCLLYQHILLSPIEQSSKSECWKLHFTLSVLMTAESAQEPLCRSSVLKVDGMYHHYIKSKGEGVGRAVVPGAHPIYSISPPVCR